MEKRHITVLTPVYNRAVLLDNLYQSLRRQTGDNFDWLIVDDGSTDQLRDVVTRWRDEEKPPFEMRYLYRENGGKHRAWNTALPYIRGDWTFVVDSDDYVTDDAIEKLNQWISQIEDDPGFAGVSGRKGRLQKAEALGCFPAGKAYVDADNLHRRSNRLTGDMAEVYRTEVLREFPFPEYEGEKFVSEGAVFGRIARAGKKLRWFPDVICICEYRSDGLTKGIVKEQLRYFNGFTYTVRESEKYNEFPVNYIWIGKFADVAKSRGLSLSEACKRIEVSPVSLWIGMSVYCLLKLRNAFRQERRRKSGEREHMG